MRQLYISYPKGSPGPTYENVSPYVGLTIIVVFTLIILRVRWLAKKDPSMTGVIEMQKAIIIKRNRKSRVERRDSQP